ncbi:TPA: hypothetical protein ACIAO0_003748 [Salmonella enterica subsp. enterica serovar Birkenhead]
MNEDFRSPETGRLYPELLAPRCQTGRHSSPDVPDGLVLETPGGQGDTPLCHVDFVVAQKWLVCAETLTQTVGGTELGGAVWRLMTDTESHLAASGPDNGERDEQ